ncbi:hypothetical protein [Pseudomonas sp. Marseille-QA0892]
MHYWNQTRYNGLNEIARALDQKGEYGDLARYCRLREQGMRSEALAALRSFLHGARQLPRSDQRTVACEIAELHHHNQPVYQLLCQPLTHYLTEVLQKWCAERPQSAAPYRWLAAVRNEPGLYQDALAIDPNDSIALNGLIGAHLQALDYATHHLSESCLIGSESDAYAHLSRSAELAMRLPISETKTRHIEDIAFYRRLLRAWDRYRRERSSLTFPDWTVRHGYDFSLGAVFYYS